MPKVIYEDIEIIASSLGKKTKQLEGKTLLISGGAGFIGSYLVATINYLNENVFKKPCNVISIDNYITGKKRKILNEVNLKNITFINADVTKKVNIKQKVDYIIHAAGLASPFYYQKYPLETIESAIFGAKNLLELAKVKKVKSFLYFSSSEIYGDPIPSAIPTPEDYKGNVSSIGPRACYDESKRLGETLSVVYFQKYNVPIKIVRPFNIYGPGMFPDDYRVIPSFIYSSLKGKILRVHDKGYQTRTFCYISDAIIGFLLVLLSSKDGEVYNVGNSRGELTIFQLAKVISSIFENKPKVRTVSYPKEYPKDEPRRRRPDLTKIETKLGYDAKINLKKGLKRTISWYREEGY